MQPKRFRFADFELDVALYELRQGVRRIALEPQVFDVLAYLVEHHDRVVSKDELLDHIWPERYISETALSSRLMAARKALGDTGRDQRFIKTVHGRGFRFIFPVTEGSVSEQAPSGAVESGATDDHEAEPMVSFARTSDGVNIAYAQHGQGPPLVRTVGWLTHLELEWKWPAGRRFWQRLGRNHRLVRYDGRGIGLSDPSEDLTLDSRIRDLEAVANCLGLERFGILAMSSGGYQAVRYAARYPERIQYLVLYGGGPDHEDDENENIQWVRYWEPLRRIMRNGWDSGSPAYRRLFTDLLLGEGLSEADVHAFDELQRSAATPQTASRFIGKTVAEGVAEAARAVRAPTLVIHRRNDLMVPISRSRRMAAMIPGARFRTLEGEAHWPVLNGGEEFAQLVDEFTAQFSTEAR